MQGLVVPVIRNVEGMNYAEIEKAMNALGEKVYIFSFLFWTRRELKYIKNMFILNIFKSGKHKWIYENIYTKCLYNVVCDETILVMHSSLLYLCIYSEKT